MARDVKERWFECFEAFDKREGGKGIWMDFLRVGGSEANAEKLSRSMLVCRLIEEKSDESGKYYRKTPDGQRLHEILKNRNYLGPFFKLIGQRRLALD